MEEITSDVMDIERKLELEVEPEDVADFAAISRTASMDGVLLMNKQRKRFCEMEFTTGEDTVGIVIMTTKDLEYYINLVIKSVAELKKIDSKFESSAVDKMLPNCSITCYIEILCKKKGHMM